MDNTRLTADRQTVFRVFFFAAFLYFLFQFLRILSPFFTPLLVATTLSLIFFPMHARIRDGLGNRPNVAAGFSIAVILLIVIVPTILFIWLMIRESAVVYPSAQQWVQSLRENPEDSFQSLPLRVQGLWDRLTVFLSTWEIDPQDIFLKNVDQLGNRISAFGATAVKNVGFLFFDILIIVFTMFFFFRDGHRMGRWITELLPMEAAHKEMVLTRMTTTLSAVVRGVFITASAQGVLAGLGFAVAGMRFAVLLGFLTAFSALIPFVGPTFVWLPVGLYFVVKGPFGKGIALLLWGALVVSLADNVLRPILIGEKAKLPVFLLFFGILGGMQVYGFIGILLGPLMIASVLAFAKIYREQYPHAPVPERRDEPPSPS